jgi:DNA-binding transcriptional regulator YdaS (Cro superfamily)
MPIPQSLAPHVREEELAPLARHLRKKLGLLVKEAARRLEVTPSALSRAEGGDPKLQALAVRAVNRFISDLVTEQEWRPGRIQVTYVARGGAADAVGELRAPERQRRAALLSQALLAHKVPFEVERGYVLVNLATEVFRVDLDTMLVTLYGRGAPIILGRVLKIGPHYEVGRDEEWTHRLDAFVRALRDDWERYVSTGEFTPLALREALKGPRGGPEVSEQNSTPM